MHLSYQRPHCLVLPSETQLICKPFGAMHVRDAETSRCSSVVSLVVFYGERVGIFLRVEVNLGASTRSPGL